MMNSGGAIISTGRVEEGPSSLLRVRFKSRGPGQFVALTSVAPSRVIIDGAILPFSHDDRTGELIFMLPMELLEVTRTVLLLSGRVRTN
jgi:hypothetical protein